MLLRLFITSWAKSLNFLGCHAISIFPISAMVCTISVSPLIWHDEWTWSVHSSRCTIKAAFFVCNFCHLLKCSRDVQYFKVYVGRTFIYSSRDHLLLVRDSASQLLTLSVVWFPFLWVTGSTMCSLLLGIGQRSPLISWPVALPGILSLVFLQSQVHLGDHVEKLDCWL